MANVTLLLGKGITRNVNLGDYGFQFDHDDEMVHVAIHLATKGLENVVKDTHAGFTIKDNPDNYKELSESAVDKKLEALSIGDLRTTSTRLNMAEQKAQFARTMLAKLESAQTPEEIAEFKAELIKMSRAA